MRAVNSEWGAIITDRPKGYGELRGGHGKEAYWRN